jgi:PAS domain-containing protein
MYDQETVSFEEYYPEPLDAWFEVRAYPSETGLSVYFRDITKRKERERKLEQTEARFQALAENFPNDGVYYFDEDLQYQYVAGAAFDPLDTSPEDLEGNTIYGVEQYSAEIVDMLESLMEKPLQATGERLRPPTRITYSNFGLLRSEIAMRRS